MTGPTAKTRMTGFAYRLLAMVCLGYLCATPPECAAQTYQHGTAGFTVSFPSGWSLRTTVDSLELTKERALLTIENPGISSGETADILTLFTTVDPGSDLTVGNPTPVDKPYPGLRTTFAGSGYAAELTVLKTPYGFYLVSLEQDNPDQVNRQVYEELLNSFAVLPPSPFDPRLTPLQPVSLGTIEIGLPDGELETRPGFLLWSSDSGGFLSAALVQRGKGEPLAMLLESWERQTADDATGIGARSGSLPLQIDEREALLADYTGGKLQARVQVSAINSGQALLLTLIASPESFRRQLPLLDLVGFSVVPIGQSAQTAKIPPAPPRAQARISLNRSDRELAEAVCLATGLDREKVALLLSSQPQLFAGLKPAMETLRQLDQFGSAATAEALSSLVTWQTAPTGTGPLADLLIAARALKVSLGLLPGSIELPAFDQAVYHKYAAARAAGQGPAKEPQAVYRAMIHSEQDFAGRQTLYGQLLKNRRLDRSTVDAQLGSYLQGKADTLLRNRLEAAWQLERFKRERGQFEAQVWAGYQDNLDKVKQAVATR